jgi:hypothetical protein
MTNNPYNLEHLTNAELRSLHEQLHLRLTGIKDQKSADDVAVRARIVAVIQERESRVEREHGETRGSGDEPLTTLYLRYQDTVYRFQVFKRHLWIEQQPGGGNKAFDRYNLENVDARIAYDDVGVWDVEALMRLIKYAYSADD